MLTRADARSSSRDQVLHDAGQIRASVGEAVEIILALAAMTRASAQDVGAQWVDRITRELQADKLPLTQPSQFTYGADAGLQYAYDSNLFLTQNDRTSDEVWIPFVQANAAYAEPQWELSGDLMVDYKYYVHTHGARDTEERVMLKGGFTGPVVGGSFVQLIRNESDPLDATFANRDQRLVSDTLPRMYVDITPIFAVEADGLVDIVRFKEKVLAAKRSGVHEVLLPAENEVNVREDLKSEQISDMEIHYVKSMDQVAGIALEPGPAQS